MKVHESASEPVRLGINCGFVVFLIKSCKQPGPDLHAAIIDLEEILTSFTIVQVSEISAACATVLTLGGVAAGSMGIVAAAPAILGAIGFTCSCLSSCILPSPFTPFVPLFRRACC